MRCNFRVANVQGSPRGIHRVISALAPSLDRQTQSWLICTPFYNLHRTQVTFDTWLPGRSDPSIHTTQEVRQI